MRAARFIQRTVWRTALALAAAGLLLGVLAIFDLAVIGRVPAPCPDRVDAAALAIVAGGGPNYERTRRAVALYETGQVGAIVFSGGTIKGDSGHGLSAEAGRLGVPAADRYVEDQARSTRDNFRLSCRMPVAAAAERIAIVTHRYHAYRALATASRYCPNKTLCSAPVDLSFDFQRRWNETRKLLGYQLLGWARF